MLYPNPSCKYHERDWLSVLESNSVNHESHSMIMITNYGQAQILQNSEIAHSNMNEESLLICIKLNLSSRLSSHCIRPHWIANVHFYHLLTTNNYINASLQFRNEVHMLSVCLSCLVSACRFWVAHPSIQNLYLIVWQQFSNANSFFFF